MVGTTGEGRRAGFMSTGLQSLTKSWRGTFDRHATPSSVMTMLSGKLAVHAEGEGGGTDLDHVTGVQRDRGDPLPVDGGAVG